MTDLMDLASRVEAREGPDRGLDADIQDAVRLGGYKADRDGCSGRLCGTMTRMASNGDGVEWKPLPAFTASLDAAMTLVPEGWAIDKISMWPAAPEGASNATAPQSHVHMVGTSLDRMGRKMVWGHSGKDGRVEATSTTPAKALTAACLRARAHQGAAHVDQ